VTTAGWAQLVALIALLAISTPLLGTYMAKVYGGGPAPGDRVFGPVERVIYRVVGVDPDREQRWTVYAFALLAFSVVSILGLYILQRIQGSLPLNPTNVGAVSPKIAFNTAISFATNTNWQSYSPETTMSHLTQVLGLAVQNFASAAVGIAVVVALVRGLVRRRQTTIGNFWVDLTRTTVRILLPMAFVAAIVLVALGTIQNLHGFTSAHTVTGTIQKVPGGPVASQEAIKELGTNGGGFFNANSAHPFENPNGLTDFLQIYLVLLIPFSLTYTFGKLVRDQKQGWVVFAAMAVLWIGAVGVTTGFEVAGNPQLNSRGVTQQATAQQPGGNMEGKESRFGPAASSLFGSSTTSTSTGAVNSSHDSYTPVGGATLLGNMMLGEVSPGGTGSGLYGMLVFVLLAVFIAGLMVGRTPEYLGKKIQSSEMKLVVLYILFVPLVALGFTAVAALTKSISSQALNPGAHGFTEVLYSYVSAANNNGSAFGGLTATSNWYTTTLALSMLVGRFLLMVPALGIAGSLVRKPQVPETAGTFPTGTPLFTALLVAVVLIVIGLTYFPALALGPITEALRI
jgi:K+-transporting ATPase ATPase A chain